jgi:flagellar biosynthesis protein FlhG
MAELSSYELMLIASGLAELEREYRYLVVDSAAGLSRQTVSFARAADVIVIVTTPDLTAMTDAYALYKVLCTAAEELRTFLLVNRASGAGEAEEVWLRIARVCERFMGSAPERLGWIPEDRTVAACVNRRGPVARLEPRAPAAGALRRIAVRLLHELGVGGEGLGVRLAR